MKAPQSAMRRIVVPVAAVVVVQPSDSRIGLIFYPCGNNYYSVGTDSAVNANDGAVVSSGGGPVEFWADKHGTVVKQEWFASANGAPLGTRVLEVFD